MPIRLLSEAVINQIAAGEVVERPASVVKELVENALDAGATQIDVRLIDGGLEQIEVQDNGSGMEEKDLRLCTQRHATSKIVCAEDLEGITSMGFRGEALSSIAAVSEITIETRTRKRNEGLGYSLNFGIAGEMRPCGLPPGTRIRVAKLFAKVPARQKFLRSSATELSHCSRLLKEIALAHPQVAFSLSHQARQLFRFATPKRRARVEEILKWKWRPIEVTEWLDTAALEAYLSPPELTDKGEVFFFINQRPVKNRVLYSVLRACYPPGVSPSGVVYLDIPPDWMDVNVHPQKTEVRFWRQERLLSWLRASFRKHLPAFPSAFSPPPLEFSNPTRPDEFEWNAKRIYPVYPGLSYLGQAHRRYLVCEDAKGLIFLHQNALDESALIKELKSQRQQGGIEACPLLPPQVFTIAKLSESLWLGKKHVLTELGFELEYYGEKDLLVKAYPKVLRANQLSEALERLITTITTDPLILLASIAAIHPSQELSPQRALSLLQTNLDWTQNSPSGKRICYRMDFDQLEKEFH